MSVVPLFQAEDMANAVLYILSTPAHMQIHDILVRPTQQTF
jgi:NADP-dependent 3-hydroxy acid dehydrogenase YdfG